MRQLWTIIKKEARDNIRDRRSLFFALLYGPVLMPLLMIGPMLYSVSKFSIDFEEPKEIMVAGLEHAPNLIGFLHQNNLDAVAAPGSYRDKIIAGDIGAVLEIPGQYEDQLRTANSADLIIHYSEQNGDSVKQKRQLETVLNQYSRQIRALRYQVRGIDERIFEPLNIRPFDHSDQRSEVDFIGYIIPFILIFSMMMGGFYLAVDTTAGERERQSLEPLMSLPISRSTLVLGKFLAVELFVLLSMTLPLITSYLLFDFMPVEEFEGAFEFGTSTFITAFWLSLPLTVLISGFLLSVASFARNTKEAQTHLSLGMMVPILPFFALQFLNVPTDALTMTVPLLSQFKLMELVVLGEALPGFFTLLSVAGSLVLALVFYLTTLWLFSRERILL